MLQIQQYFLEGESPTLNTLGIAYQCHHLDSPLFVGVLKEILLGLIDHLTLFLIMV